MASFENPKLPALPATSLFRGRPGPLFLVGVLFSSLISTLSGTVDRYGEISNCFTCFGEFFFEDGLGDAAYFIAEGLLEFLVY